MSTILKALKKVEGKGQVRASSFPEDLPLLDKPHGRRSVSRSLLLLLVTGALIGAGGWQIYDRLTAGIASRTSSPPVEQGVAPALPPSDPAPVTAGMEPVGLPEAGALAIRSVEGPAAPPKHRRRAVETVSRPRRKQAETGVGAPVAVRTPASGPPRLVVTGIAYQEDRLGRLAIVNDQPLGEGEKVGGAVISVILEDRVQFSRAGETFEIPLTKAGSSRR